MASAQNLVLFVSVMVLCLFVQKGSAIRCFECNSHNDTRCADAIPPETLSKECGEHKHGNKFLFCRKITQIIEFAVNNLPPDSRVIRGCGYDESAYKGKCYSRAGFGGRQEVCSCYLDNCNSADAVKSTVFAAIVAGVAAFYTIVSTF